MWSCRHTESMSGAQFRTRESSNLTINTECFTYCPVIWALSKTQTNSIFSAWQNWKLYSLYLSAKQKICFSSQLARTARIRKEVWFLWPWPFRWNFLDSSNHIKYHFWKQEYQGSLCIPLVGLYTWLHSGTHTVNSTINHLCKAAKKHLLSREGKDDHPSSNTCLSRNNIKEKELDDSAQGDSSRLCMLIFCSYPIQRCLIVVLKAYFSSIYMDRLRRQCNLCITPSLLFCLVNIQPHLTSPKQCTGKVGLYHTCGLVMRTLSITTAKSSPRSCTAWVSSSRYSQTLPGLIVKFDFTKLMKSVEQETCIFLYFALPFDGHVGYRYEKWE